MRTVVVVIFLLLPQLLFGQQPERLTRHRVSIGLSVVPTLNYRTISRGGSDALVIADRNGQEISAVGFDAGAIIRVAVSQQLALESGLWFSRKGYQTVSQDLGWSSSSTDYPLSSTTHYRYDFVSLPLKASYSFGTGNWQGFVGAGAALNVFVLQQTQVRLKYSGHESTASSPEEIGISQFHLVPILSAGMRYRLLPKMSVQVEPIFHYYITPLRPDLPIREHLYSGGVGLSVFRRL